MHFLWLILILHMLLKSYSLKSNLSKLTSGPYFVSSIKLLKPFETTSCTSLTMPAKLLFHFNYTLRHQKNIRSLLERDPSLKALHWARDTALSFLSCLAQSLSSSWTLPAFTPAHMGTEPVFQGGCLWGTKVTDLLCIYRNTPNSFLISN